VPFFIIFGVPFLFSQLCLTAYSAASC